MFSSEWLWAWLILGGILIVALTAIMTIVVVRHRRRPAAATSANPEELDKKAAGGGVWIVVNPVKPTNYERFKAEIEEEVLRATGRPPFWIETTVEDPGTGQAIEALRHKPSLVVAAGGDGTVRAVAAGMAFSGVPMALLPMGTGNLMARNLGIPLTHIPAIRLALTPISRRVDLAWLSVDRVEEESAFPAEGHLLVEAGAKQVRTLPEWVREPEENEYAYLVIAGVGFDGQTMANTTSEMKKKVGWSAYVLTSFKALRIERMKATVTVYRTEGDRKFIGAKSGRGLRVPSKVQEAVRATGVLGVQSGASPDTCSTENWDMTPIRARTVLFANCGELPFAQLAPAALIDDGQLDVIAIDTQGGLLGWFYLSVKVFGNQAGLHPINVKNDLATLQFRQTPTARVDISKAYPVQVDGDPIGTARTVISRVDQGALLIRVPSGSPAAIPDWDRRI
ncbi:diacylglycerol/lipid kinase family protein [Actinomyces minihominis]|uniref:diacylglycerol/lipid kinase family protein n=1 Tax=Actinomyces minihominis TaxID=2002838 RepID=UPI000C06A6F6|nr:diacylglycerol kinase family protein [Actinomyces minihominis]